MRKVEKSKVVRDAEIIKATIICSTVGLIVLFNTGVKLGAMLVGLMH